ncbi:MAG: hypothetical protein JXR61_09975 [Prolixibacteraceae bacterium]|nr:hypothetical protein [Prolixibacteraceae bacterium]
MINEFSYNFYELEISLIDIAEQMGFSENPIPDPFPDLITKVLNSNSSIFQARAGFKYFDQINVDSKNFTLTIGNQTFSPGKIITTQLKGANSCAIFVCTAGYEIERKSKKFAENGDQIQSYIYDVLGSIVAEKTRIKIEHELKNEMEFKGLRISNSFSPGYCDWNISEQKKLFSLLPKNFCGITLSNSLLMTPVKSVSGIIGVGKSLIQNGYQCKWCSNTNCLYRKTNNQKKN